MPTSGSEFNLAGNKFESLWKDEMFDLGTWEAGRCHTYFPDKSTPPGKKGLLYAHLGDISYSGNHFKGYEIYLTDGTTFWANTDLSLGEKTSHIFLQPGQQFEGIFRIKKIRKLAEIGFGLSFRFKFRFWFSLSFFGLAYIFALL